MRNGIAATVAFLACTCTSVLADLILDGRSLVGTLITAGHGRPYGCGRWSNLFAQTCRILPVSDNGGCATFSFQDVGERPR